MANGIVYSNQFATQNFAGSQPSACYFSTCSELLIQSSTQHDPIPGTTRPAVMQATSSNSRAGKSWLQTYKGGNLKQSTIYLKILIASTVNLSASGNRNSPAESSMKNGQWPSCTEFLTLATSKVQRLTWKKKNTSNPKQSTCFNWGESGDWTPRSDARTLRPQPVASNLQPGGERRGAKDPTRSVLNHWDPID